MCGIAGIVTLKPSDQAGRIVRQMTDAIRHRGPDDCGYYSDNYASLGHRRLSIIDLSTGHQPMFNESGDLCIIYNGEIFNHAELRPSLERAGHHYATHSDTETILHAYEEYGPNCVRKFRGMFAFAIWDRKTRTLFCARDRLGIKPFYYYWDGRLFAFASEIKALLQHPAVSATFDESVLPEYLAFGYSSDDRTLFKGVRKLMPGNHVLLTPDGVRFDRYWEIPRQSHVDDRDDRSWISECRARLEETVRMRLMSDVPLGMFLSGGVDSSAIAALMGRMTGDRVKSFSVGYSEAQYSELGYAAEVSQCIGTEHHQVTVGRNEFFDVLPGLIWHEDEPIVWPSSVSLFFVSKLASRHVKVVLTGEGADELFGGYERYRFYLANRQWMARYSRVPASVRRRLRSLLASSDLLSGEVRRKLEHTVLGHEPTVESFYIDNFYSALDQEEQRQLLLSNRVNVGSPYESFLAYWKDYPDAGGLGQLLYTDQKTYLVELLMKQDQMSMACSIESRVPFLDHPFVEFAARVPDHLKIRGRVRKYILKEAVADLLPEKIVSRRKMGFPTPLKDWLRGPAATPLLDTIRDRQGFVAEYFNLPALNALLDRHAAGKVDATDRIWRLLNLQIWGGIFISRTLAPIPPVFDENPVGQI